MEPFLGTVAFFFLLCCSNYATAMVTQAGNWIGYAEISHYKYCLCVRVCAGVNQ